MPSVSDESHRRQQFKNTSRHEDARRRRNEGSLELRKKKNFEQLMKRRNIDEASGDDAVVSPEKVGSGGDQEIKQEVLTLKECHRIITKQEEARYRDAVCAVRRVLSSKTNPPIEEVIGYGFIPFLVAALDAPECQLEASWALTNILSGTTEQTRACLDEGVVPRMVQLLLSPSMEVAEQAAWALGNIIGDGADMRDAVLNVGGLQPLLDLAEHAVTDAFLRTLTWTFSNICRHRNLNVDVAKAIIPVLMKLITHQDRQVKADAIWAFSYLSDGKDDVVEAVIACGVLPIFIELLDSEDAALASPSLRTLGNLVTGSDEQTQVVLNTGILNGPIGKLLTSSKLHLRKEAMWFLSNIAAGNQDQAQELITSGLIPTVVELLETGDFKCQCEAAWVLTNIATGGSQEQVIYMVSCGAIPPICALLKAKEPRIVSTLLDCIGHIFTHAEAIGEMEQMSLAVEACGGLDNIEELQHHENENIYQQASGIVEKYFGADENQAPEHGTAQGEVPDGGFSF